MRIIDAHMHYHTEGHFNQLAVEAGHQNSEAHLREVYAAQGIEAAIVMSNRPLEDPHDYPDFMRYCLGLNHRTIGSGAVRDELALAEAHLRRNDCAGFKLYPGYDPHYVTDPAFEPYYDLARSYNKPVAIHTGATARADALLRYSHPMTLDELAVRHPEVQFVMCHFGNPFLPDAAAVLAKNRNIACDLSGILEGKPDIDALFRDMDGYLSQLRGWIGYVGDYSRVLYGTDWPLANIPGYIDFVSRLIPEAHWDDVFFHNANRIYQFGL